MTNTDRSDLEHLRNINATLTETTIEQAGRDRIRETMGVVGSWCSPGSVISRPSTVSSAGHGAVRR